MILTHLSTTNGTACGIGEFAGRLHMEMTRLQEGGDKFSFASNDATIQGRENPSILLYHHEFSFDLDWPLKTIRPKRKVCFIHTPLNKGPAPPELQADAYICMNSSMIKTDRPVLQIKCPGYVGQRSPSLFRNCLKDHGMPERRPVIGTFSMAGRMRKAQAIINSVKQLIPVTAVVFAANHESKSSDDTIPSADIHISDFTPSESRYGAMKACDVLWCYSNVIGRQYASASVSDMYSSGTRLVTNDVPQHSHIIGRRGVVPVPPSSGPIGIASALVREVKSRDFTKHDVDDEMTFRYAARQVVDFLKGLK